MVDSMKKKVHPLSFIAGILLLFVSSCGHSEDARLDINGYSYYHHSVEFGREVNNNQTVQEKDSIRYLSISADEMFNTATSDLYEYDLSIDIFLPDTTLFEGKKYSLSDPLEKEFVLELWNNLSADATNKIIFNKPNVFITIYRWWYVHVDGYSKGVTVRNVKEFSGLDGWVTINKNENNKYETQFECIVVSEEDGETFKVSGYCGR